MLGVCYENGTGVDQDHAAAVRWYRLAAAQGYASAQYSLGVCYGKGAGVEQDHTEAVRLCRLAANQSFAPAQQLLTQLGV
jgi:TPR repeat protein